MINVLIFLIALSFVNQPFVAFAKFGEAPPTPGKVKCCFGKGGGFLSGRCLEMTEAECTLKRGAVVGDCKQCEEWSGEARPVKGKVKCCFRKGGGASPGRCLELPETECTLKRGVIVPECKQCEGQ